MSSDQIKCGNCGTMLMVPVGHGGIISCGVCQTNLQVGVKSELPPYNAVVGGADPPPVITQTTIITPAGGCPRCQMHEMSTPRWTITAWLLCLCFFPWNFCVPGCQPSESYCRNCGYAQFVDM